RKGNIDYFLIFFGWFASFAVWFVLKSKALVSARSIDLGTAIESVFKNSPAFISYFGKVVLPFNLSGLPILRDIKIWYGIIAIVAVFVALLLSKKKRMNYILFGVAWFFLFLAPSLVISFLKHEYRLYIPLLGCIILFSEIDFIKNYESSRKKHLIAFASVVVLFSFITFRYSDIFNNRMTFWRAAVKTSPHSPLAHRNLGAMLYLDGDFDNSIIEYNEALKLNPYEAMAHNNLGLIYFKKKMLNEAEREYKREIKINPTYDNVHFNLGLLYYSQGKQEQAAELWKKTIVLNAKYVEAYKYLAMYYYNNEDYKAASYYIEELKKKGIFNSQLIGALSNKGY
ncbi:MAG: tetratricopeptide repeat protein, partial [Candidatus Zapsychrus exili]|nr:tetratricopeptide repeat protein [Candidatus Zapsychrus exili]